MESRAKFSKNYKPPGPMSRTVRDLEAYLNGRVSATDENPELMLKRLLPKGRKPRICVVGAGVAGLKCAQFLGGKGVDVTIFEARDRVGGRMHQTLLGSNTVDHGPNWIHGTEQNPILDLAKQLEQTIMDVPDVAPTMIDPAGDPVDKEEAKRCFEMMWEIVEEAFTYSNKDSASIPQDQSLLDFFSIKIKEKGLPKATADRVMLVAEQWGDYVGGSTERQSLKYMWLEETIDGGNVFLASTYKAILEHITKETLSTAKLRLSTKVVSITSLASQAKQSLEDFSSVIVTTSDGTTHSFDEVVMTAPLGWLKRNSNIFDPRLPPRILQSLSNMTYGSLEKVYLTFPSAFWQKTPPSKTSPIKVNLSSSKIDLSSPKAGPLPPKVDPFPPKANPFFNQWLRPDYTPNHWAAECAFLSILPGECAHPTLLFYMHGDLGQYVTTMASKLKPSSPEYLSALSKFFEPYYSRLPGYQQGEKACTPTHALATNWSNDEFAGWGSYTNFQIADQAEKKVEQDKDIIVLRQACPHRRLWFAGEHTSPFVALGTVTGAWMSGEMAAKRILGVYGMGGDNGGVDGGGDGGNGGKGNGGGNGGGMGGGDAEKIKGDGVAGKRGGTGLGAKSKSNI
ncbi:MAG: hypothetical protein Q9220_007545 [cf. Caloplaca sp. 1 TL-2023]